MRCLDFELISSTSTANAAVIPNSWTMAKQQGVKEITGWVDDLCNEHLNIEYTFLLGGDEIENDHGGPVVIEN